MKNKKLLSVLSLGIIAGTLVSCGNAQLEFFTPKNVRVTLADGSTLTANQGEPIVRPEEDGEVIKINDPTDPAIAGKLTSLEIKNPTIALLYNDSSKIKETAQLELSYKPYTADVSNLVYESSNEKVATVSKTGLVTAVKEGRCVITVKSSDGTISDSVNVSVNNGNLPINFAKNRKNSIANAQASPDFVQPESFYVSQTSSSQRVNIVDGGDIVTSAYTYEENFWISKKNSYFRITEISYEQKVAGGSLVLDAVDYIFYTTPDFYSYAFKTSTYSKNYMKIDQSSLIETGDPFNGLLEVLDNFFTSGKAIVNNNINGVYGQDLINDAEIWNSVQLCGYLSDSPGQLNIEALTNHNYQVGPDQEEDFDIPAYTPFTVTETTKALWEDNLVQSKLVNSIWEWNLEDGSLWQDRQKINYAYQTKDVELLYPDVTKYNKVDTIFDL